ncbi:hypothetical protein ABZ942_40580 [Nocardia sp. NPDC046473]
MTAVILLIAVFVLANLLLRDGDAQDFHGREIAESRYRGSRPRSSCSFFR